MFSKLCQHLTIAVIAMLFLALALSGCASQQSTIRRTVPPADTVEPPPPPDNVQADDQPEDGAVLTGPPGCIPIMFDYDRANIRPDQRLVLDSNVPLLLNGEGHILLKGYCDERGTWDYNLALGERRGLAVARALNARGIAAKRLGVVSMGKEGAEGRGEIGWAMDRRVEFTIQD